MIQANDLRVGNLVIYLPFREVFCVKEISPAAFDDGLGVAYDYVLYNKGTFARALMGQAEPIPLTPELLERCGFEPYEKVGLMHKGDNFIGLLYLNRKMYINTLTATDSYNNIEIGCYYLHQLQNLYYVLTGEELNIQL